MRRKIWFTLIIFLLITACKVGIPLSVNILGAWVGRDSFAPTSRPITYKMDFLPFGKVYIRMVALDEKIEKFSGSYTIDERTNTVYIKSRLLIEFQATVTKNQLHITGSKYNVPPEGIYFRTLASRSIYGLLFVGLLFFCMFHAKRKRSIKRGNRTV